MRIIKVKHFYRYHQMNVSLHMFIDYHFAHLHRCDPADR